MNCKINPNVTESLTIEGQVTVKRSSESNFIRDIQTVIDRYSENKKYNIKIY